MPALILCLLEEGEPVRAAQWAPRQWIGFLVYAGLLIGLMFLAWRLASPDPEQPAP
jgi:hypothetical protein